MERARKTWEGQWRVKVLSRIHAVGCDTVRAFLTRFPAKPYIYLAETLGNDVAAAQLEKMQFEEANKCGSIRDAAMDSLPREFAHHLPGGWRGGARGDFDTASVFASWETHLHMLDPALQGKAAAVWAALESLQPPLGWKPTGASDHFIDAAFAEGWPGS
jgi:hypothetical protein